MQCVVNPSKVEILPLGINAKTILSKPSSHNTNNMASALLRHEVTMQGIAALVRRLAAQQHEVMIEKTCPIVSQAALRHFSKSSNAMHVQAVHVENDKEIQPRWKRELGAIRTDWTYVMNARFDIPLHCSFSSNYLDCSREEVSDVFNAPLLDLVHNAATVHRMHNDPSMVSTFTVCLLYNITL